MNSADAWEQVFAVEVTHNEPQGWPITDSNTKTAGFQLTSCVPAKEYRYRAEFCADCRDRIQVVLAAAGLVKSQGVDKPESLWTIDMRRNRKETHQ